MTGVEKGAGANWRRGLGRLLIVAAVGYWALAVVVAHQAFQSADWPKGELTLRTVNGKYLSIGLDPGVTCQSVIKELRAELRKPPHNAVLEQNACAGSERNVRYIKQRNGWREVRRSLADWAGAFAWIAGVMGAAWWVVSGFANKAASGPG